MVQSGEEPKPTPADIEHKTGDPKPTDGFEKTLGFFQEGKVYNAFTSWFEIPQDERTKILQDTLVKGLDYKAPFRTLMREAELPHEKFIFKLFPVLTSTKAEKLFTAKKGEVLDNDDTWLGNDEEQSVANMVKLLKPFGIDPRVHPYSIDQYDFQESDVIIRRNFSLEEEREFLRKVLPGAQEGSYFYKRGMDMTSLQNMVNPIRHADLLLDPELSQFIESRLIVAGLWETTLFSYLSQGAFPSAEFFEEAFRRNSEIAQPDKVLSANGKDIPASAFYYTILRRMVQKRDTGADMATRKEKVVGYLLSDSFMEHALPFLDTDEVYSNSEVGDVMVYEDDQNGRYVFDVEATGEEAKQIKKQRLGEVIRAAIGYASEKGDEETVRKLKEREIGAAKFADFLTN